MGHDPEYAAPRDRQGRRPDAYGKFAWAIFVPPGSEKSRSRKTSRRYGIGRFAPGGHFQRSFPAGALSAGSPRDHQNQELRSAPRRHSRRRGEGAFVAAANSDGGTTRAARIIEDRFHTLWWVRIAPRRNATAPLNALDRAEERWMPTSRNPAALEDGGAEAELRVALGFGNFSAASIVYKRFRSRYTKRWIRVTLGLDEFLKEHDSETVANGVTARPAANSTPNSQRRDDSARIGPRRSSPSR